MSGGETMNNEIKIKGGEIFLADDINSVYEIMNGDALVYIVPIEEDDLIGRRLFIYEAGKGEKVPALNHEDLDKQKWKFAIVAIDETDIRVHNVDEIELYKKEFAQKINLKNYEMEGFEEGIVEWYRFQILKEDGFIHKIGQDQKQTYENGLKLIYNLFNAIPKKTEEKSKNNTTYDAVSFLCRKSKINVASYEKIKESCGNNITIENISRISHFTIRKIVLEENWFKKDLGPILVYL